METQTTMPKPPGRATKKRPGPVPGPATQKITVLLDPDDLEWGKSQPGGLSATLRRLLKEAREKREK